MLENEGHWIKLMRTATLPTDANICLRISGKDIVCTVTKDVNREVELKVTCRIVDEGDDQDSSHEKSKEVNSTVEIPTDPEPPEGETEEQKIVPKICPSPEAMLDFASDRVGNLNENTTCRNSSSAKYRELSEDRSAKSENNGNESDCEMDDLNEEVSSSTIHESPSSDENSCKRSAIKSELEASSKALKSSESEASLKHNDSGTYRCRICDFVCSEQYTYEKHIRSHHNPSSTRTSSHLTNPRSFCDACKIQFMSVNTYQVHKKYYCKSRHESEDVPTSNPAVESSPGNIAAAFRPASDTVILRGGINGSVTSSLIQPQAIYAAISTNPLILLPCSLVSGQGLVPQNGVISSGSPGIVLQTGIGCPTIVEKPTTAKTREDSGPAPPRKTSQPVMNVIVDPSDRSLLSTSKISSLKRKMSEGDVLNLKKTISDELHVSIAAESSRDSEKVIMDQDSPLDLSIKKKRSPDPMSSRSPIKRRNSSASIERPSPPLHCLVATGSSPGPSLIAPAHEAVSPSNSYSNESNSCYATQVPVVVQRLSQGVSERISPLPPVLQAAVAGDKPVPAPGMPPPKLMKQGNNICEECHIVFYKYDNYLAHKKHYCAYRRQQLSALAAAAAAAAASSSQEQSSDDNNSNHSGLNEASTSYQTDDPAKAGMRRMDYGMDHFRSVITKPPQSVYCCDACGVKFSTSDNLNAHQTYYCIKKADSAMSKVVAKKGDGDSSPKSLESPFSGPEEWKCNYCDATGSSYETIRRHLLTHSELRGFRCLVCGYKGNTLRGMRTHACEHLTEDSTSIEEFVSSTVITEGGGIMPILSRNVECGDEDSNPSREPKGNVEMERSSSSTSEDKSHLKLEKDNFDSEDLSNGQTESSPKEHVPKRISSIKTESGESSSDATGSCHQDTVNPLAFCDVVIKTENDQPGSGDEASRDEHPHSAMKYEPETEYSSEDRRDRSVSPPFPQSRSVIRVAADIDKSEDKPQVAHSSKRRNRSQNNKTNSELKYCKSCDISFYHLSNFLAHKKYYCVSRVIQNCLPETATVQ